MRRLTTTSRQIIFDCLSIYPAVVVVRASAIFPNKQRHPLFRPSVPCLVTLHILTMIRSPNKSPSTLDPHYIRVENFELDTVDLADAPGSNTPAESLWEILDYDPTQQHYKMGEWLVDFRISLSLSLSISLSIARSPSTNHRSKSFLLVVPFPSFPVQVIQF